MFWEDLEFIDSTVNEETNDGRELPSAKGEAFLWFFNIKTAVECPFAKHAVVVDHMHWNQNLAFDENLAKLFISAVEFTTKCDEYRLDGFLVTAPSSFSHSPAMLGEFLRRILFYLSEHDPLGVSSLDEDMEDPKWRYRFANKKFFVAAFSPCYNEGSNRSTFGADQTVIIFQPKNSFERIMSRNKESKFSQRQYIRDKFCRAGVPYNLRELEREKFVVPHAYGDKAVEWWKPNYNFDFGNTLKNYTTQKSRACVVM